MVSNNARLTNTAVKRKRDDITAFRMAPGNREYLEPQGAQELLNIHHLTPELTGIESCISKYNSRLMPGGDLVALNASTLSLCLNVFDPTRRAVINISFDNCEIDCSDRGFSMSVGFGDIRGIIACSATGSLLLCTVEADGTVLSSQQGIALTERENVSYVLHAGDCYVVGTSAGDLHLIRREGPNKALFMEKLKRSQNVFMGLFQTGAKMLGLAEGVKKDPVNKIVVPREESSRGASRHKLLFSQSKDVLSLWGGWTQPGEEQLYWDVSLRNLLLPNILEASFEGHNRKLVKGDYDVVDVECSPYESEASSGTLLVLSSFTDNSSSPPSSSLWLHVLSFSAAPTPSTRGGQTQRQGSGVGVAVGPLSVRARLLIAKGSQLGTISTQGPSRPKLLKAQQFQSWRLYVSWLSAQSETMRVVHIDVKNLPDLSDTDCTEEQCEMDRSGVTSEDSGIKEEDLVSVATVRGREGVHYLSTDGSITAASPPLISRIVRSKFVLNTGSGMSRASAEHVLAQAAELAEGAKLLMSVCVGESSLEHVSARLNHSLSNSSQEDLSAMIVSLSNKIGSKASLGQNWGQPTSTSFSTSGPAGLKSSVKTRSRGRAECQLARRLVSDKLDSHSRLMQALMDTGIIDVIGASHKSSILKTHQALLGSSGLCSAIEEAQQRVGIDPYAYAAEERDGGAGSQYRNSTRGGNSEGDRMFDTGLSGFRTLLTYGIEGGDEGAGVGVEGGGERNSLYGMTDRLTATTGHSSAPNLRGANSVFLRSASKEGLRVTAMGMERLVQGSDNRLDDFASQGLSNADVFFSESSELSAGLLAIAKTLTEQSTGLAARGALLAASYGVACCMLSAITAANGVDRSDREMGAEDPSAAFACDENVSRAVLEVLAVFTAACEAVAAVAVSEGRISLTRKTGLGLVQGRVTDVLLPAGDALEAFYEEMGIGRAQEGKVLKSLCTAVLDGVVLAARTGTGTASPESAIAGKGVTDAWKLRFHNAKSQSIGALLQLGHYASAFDLSAVFLHPIGMLESMDLAADNASDLRFRFKDVVRGHADCTGTEIVKIPTFCMQWMESRGRPVSVLEVGKLAVPQLRIFLESRPHISWMRDISCQQHAAAATAAVDHGYRETRHSTASTLLSIAKLSALLSSPCPHPKPSIPLSPSSSPSSSSPSSSSVRAGAQHVCVSSSLAAREANANLAVLAAQTTISNADTSLLRDCGDLSDRLPPSLIIDKLILLAQSRGAGLDINSLTLARGRTRVGSDVDPIALDSAVADTVRYLSTALGQLSILKDHLHVRTTQERNDLGSDSRSGSVDDGERRERGVRADEQLLSVWATALRVQEGLWVDLAAASYPEEGQTDIVLGALEDDVIASSVLGRLAAECKASLADNLLRHDVYPRSTPRQRERNEEGEGEGEEQDERGGLRHDAVLDIKAIMDSSNFRDNSHTQRIAHLIKGCLEMRSDVT